MPFQRLFVIALLALPYTGARSDDIIYDYSGDVLPSDPASGWIVANPCEGSCTELIEDGRFVLFWPVPGDWAAYGHFIAVAPEEPPPTLWVEWRFRSNYEFTGLNAGCDVTLNITYGFMLDGVDILGDAVISRSGDDGVGGLALNEFHTYRFESLDTGRNYWFGVDGLVFLVDADNTPSANHAIVFSASGGCSGDSFVNKRQEWDYIRYGTISFGEQIIAADPPAGLLDATPSAGLDRFTVTFDAPNYVFLDDITVEVTGGIAPVITQTQRGDDTDPAKVEIVLDAPLPLNETTRFTFDDGVAVNVVEYTLVPIGACCFPGGSCEERIDSECSLEGGSFIDGPCEGDADGDGIDGRCGDPCPFDNSDDTDGDGVCDTNDPCPIDNPDDTDNDGVCDSVDACPGFDDNLDTDGDTIPDCSDQCPGADDALFAPECTIAIPTTTAWGVVVLVLGLLTLAKLAAIWKQTAFRHSAPRG